MLIQLHLEDSMYIKFNDFLPTINPNKFKYFMMILITVSGIIVLAHRIFSRFDYYSPNPKPKPINHRLATVKYTGSEDYHHQ